MDVVISGIFRNGGIPGANGLGRPWQGGSAEMIGGSAEMIDYPGVATQTPAARLSLSK